MIIAYDGDFRVLPNLSSVRLGPLIILTLKKLFFDYPSDFALAKWHY
jgi:hypothetical protein